MDLGNTTRFKSSKSSRKRLTTHEANGNGVALITSTFYFPKTWKRWGFYLSPCGKHNSVMRESGDGNKVSIESWTVTSSN